MARTKGSKNKPKEAPDITEAPKMPSPENPNLKPKVMTETQLRQTGKFPGFFSPDGRPL